MAARPPSHPPLKRLLDRSFARGPAEEANVLIDQIRTRYREEQGFAIGMSYEVVMIGRTWRYILDVVAPRLSMYLRSKRMGVFSCQPVFISLFSGETLYFIRAADLFEVVRISEGLCLEAFRKIAEQWEKTGIRTPRLLLSP